MINKTFSLLDFLTVFDPKKKEEIIIKKDNFDTFIIAFSAIHFIY